MNRPFPLALRWNRQPLRAAAAWCISGNNPARWIEEIASWPVPMARLKLLVLPASISDPAAAGALVILDDATAAKNIRSTAAAPYGVLAGRLYLPVDAALDPDVREQELLSRLRHDLLILHPAIGLIGFSSTDALGVADLIARPKPRDVNWNRAQPGVSIAPRLLSVEAETPPTLDTILDNSRDDIGSHAPREPKPARQKDSPLKDAMTGIGRPMIRLMDWIARNSPKISPTSGWLDALGHWASAQLKGVDAKIDDTRMSELQKLLSLMESNPDIGLQHAIPLAAKPTRGIAPPASKLPSRPVDFNLSRLRGSGRADPWQVPWHIHQKLLQQYRNAANRELALGRHRRAAYIFAELLGDYSSAANALRQGKHYREAAALYRENLHNLRASAECLEEGGQLVEAAQIFESLKSWVRAGDLYARIDRPIDATRCWHEAVRDCAIRQDYLPAAKLLEQRLNDPDAALNLLESAWPLLDKAALCLAESFELLGRLGRHDRAAQRITKVLNDGAPPDRITSMVQTLSATARVYPDASVRGKAADAARVVAGNRLAAADRAETAALVQAITRLSPEDRLLLRDGNRFVAKANDRPRPYPLAKPIDRQPKLVRTIQLFKPIERENVFYYLNTVSVDANGDAFFALGSSQGFHQVVRGSWSGEVGSYLSTALSGQCSLVINPSNRNVIIFDEQGRILPEVVPGASWVNSPIRGICFSEHDTAWVANDHGVSCHSAGSGKLLARHDFPFETSSWLPMAARKDDVFICHGANLIQISSSGQITNTELPRGATGITATRMFTRVRLCITLQEGAIVLWPGGSQQMVAEGLFDPLATFLPDGTLIIVSKDGGRAFRTGGGSITCIGSFGGLAERPVAISGTDTAGEFAVFTQDGRVLIYQGNFIA